MIDKSSQYNKKNKKRIEELKDQKDASNELHIQKEQLKHQRLEQLHQQLEGKLRDLEKKFQEKDLMASSIRMAMEEYVTQKRELKNLKKQEQESNLRRHRRVQSAYKKILIDKILEKDERARLINMRKEKLLQFRQKALAQSNHRNVLANVQIIQPQLIGG